MNKFLDSFVHSNYLSALWDWALEFMSKAAEPVLFASVIYAGYQLLPRSNPLDAAFSVSQLVALDIGGLGLMRMSRHKGLPRSSFPYTIGMILIGLMIANMVLAEAVRLGLSHEISAWCDGMLLIARAIMAVLFGSAIFALQDSTAPSETPKTKTPEKNLRSEGQPTDGDKQAGDRDSSGTAVRSPNAGWYETVDPSETLAKTVREILARELQVRRDGVSDERIIDTEPNLHSVSPSRIRKADTPGETDHRSETLSADTPDREPELAVSAEAYQHFAEDDEDERITVSEIRTRSIHVSGGGYRERVRSLILENPELTAPQVAETLGIGISTAKRHCADIRKSLTQAHLSEETI